MVDYPKPPYPDRKQPMPGTIGAMTAYVMLADPRSSYTLGATVAVTGGNPFI